ncbi:MULTISPECIES: transketolase [unclassified Roseitalea]|uniref:transketolase n=1 Tax=unclassified Roseitalea TaxID=2639107 RepID=UPI00273E06D9|nr:MULTISPECIES: transketolase [unclassified Roseitalea]
MIPREKHDRMANAIRALAMDAVQAAGSGHPGLPMGAADIATVLFTRFMKFDPKHPHWPDRDRFVLSAGHGSMLLYGLLYLLGYEDVTLDEIRNFRQLGSRTAGHPEYGHAAGIETTTGPLGQGLANGVGMAIAERKLRDEFGADLVNHKIYVLAGDGCLMEGISQEAISLAGHLGLDNLVVIWDDNRITIDGDIALADSTDQIARFEACGWATDRIDGHDPDAIEAALTRAGSAGRPVMIAARTTIGFGAPTKAGTAKAHGSPLGPEEIAGARIALGWQAEPFEIPSEILDDWRLAGLSSGQERVAWQKRLDAVGNGIKSEFERRMRGDLPSTFFNAVGDYKAALARQAPTAATRKSSQMALEVINAAIPETLGGSADLSGSNNTKTEQTAAITPGDFSGRYIHYGIREHAMAAAMNGIALHGGLMPYGGTFLVFSDYARPAMRLASLMGIRSIFVMTHDSIGLGEDGPTHQPVEHLAALRAIPNHLVFRPADAMEVVECWELALGEAAMPSTLALTRQDLPALRTETASENRCALGAYELATAGEESAISLFATGSEVHIAMQARERLIAQGHRARVVSVPCFELFERQSPEYRRAIIGTDGVRIAVEAGVRQGWERFIGEDGIFIGMSGFGASGPYKALYEHFGITADAIVEAALARLARRTDAA